MADMDNEKKQEDSNEQLNTNLPDEGNVSNIGSP